MCGDIYPRYSYKHYHSNHYSTHDIVGYFTDVPKDFFIYKFQMYFNILLEKDKYIILDIWGATYPPSKLLQSTWGSFDPNGGLWPPALFDEPKMKKYHYPKIPITEKITAIPLIWLE